MKVGTCTFASVTPRREEVGLDGPLLLGGNNITCLKLCEHCFYGLVFVPEVVFLQILDVLRVDGRKNGFYCHRVDQLLEVVLLPVDLMVLLELEELALLGVVLGFWAGELRFGEPLAVEVVVPDGETHFGLAEDEQEETVLATPFGGCKMARKGCKFLDEVSHGVEGGLNHDCFDRDGFHPTPHNFDDGGHGC